MRLERVEFKGYKRLVDTSFYVNRRLVAIVGPNEAGKSSILAGLQTLEAGDEISAAERSRSVARDDTTPIVVATYRLSEGDQHAIAELPLHKPVETIVRSKFADGRVRIDLSPKPLYRSPLFGDAHSAVSSLQREVEALREKIDFTESRADGTQIDHAQVLIQAFSKSWPVASNQAKFSGAEWDSIWKVYDTWDDHNGTNSFKTKWRALKRYYDEVVALPTLTDRVLAELTIPVFQTFRESDRSLGNEYDLDHFADSDSLPAPLRNLLEFAELPLERLREAMSDEPLIESLISKANSHVQAKFAERWKQSKVAVWLKIKGTLLQVFVEDTETGNKAFFSERSDGLRMFVALMLFLEHEDSDRAPILLIDEADVHLHLDAQADLITLLTTFMRVTQVIYTTHSPGCLPPDLGTGVRFLEPDIDMQGSSTIAPFFWSKSKAGRPAGLLPILFMLGARSAAFSRLRCALVVEGQTEALLMPTLIRAATGLEDLEYQLVPGLSQAGQSEFKELNESAVNVAYLADGDKGGDDASGLA